MGRRLALLIGSLTYDDPKFRRLQKPDADVTSLASVLRDPLIGAFDDIQTSIDSSVATVRRDVASLFAHKDSDDLLLLYFAGHGIKDEYGHLHLALADTDSELLSATSLAADFVASEMDRSRSRKQILILDCCFSGAFGKTRAPEVVRAGHAFAGGAAGRIILTASDAFQYVWEDESSVSIVNSLFTHYLVDGLQTGKADTDDDGVITADEWYEYVYKQVRNATPKQTPQRTVYAGAGSLLIAHNAHPRASLPSEITSAMKSPLPYVREGVTHELIRLLAGAHVGLQAAAREGLQQLSVDIDTRVRSLATAALAPSSSSQSAIAASPTAKPSPPPRPARPVRMSVPEDSARRVQSSSRPSASPGPAKTTADRSSSLLNNGRVLQLTQKQRVYASPRILDALIFATTLVITGLVVIHSRLTESPAQGIVLAALLPCVAALVSHSYRSYARGSESSIQFSVAILVILLSLDGMAIAFVNAVRREHSSEAHTPALPTNELRTSDANPATSADSTTTSVDKYRGALPVRPNLDAIHGEVADATSQHGDWMPFAVAVAAPEQQRKERATLLYVWATWLPVGRRQLSGVNQLRGQYEQNVSFVGLLDDEDRPSVRERVAQVAKPLGLQNQYILKDSAILMQIFGIPGVPLPAFALYDGSGKLVWTHIGFIDDPIAAGALRQVLAAQVASAKNGIAAARGDVKTQSSRLGVQLPPITYKNLHIRLLRHDPQRGELETTIQDVAPNVGVHYSDFLNWGAEIKVYVHGRETPATPLHLRKGESGTVTANDISVTVTLNEYSTKQAVVSVTVVERR